VVDRQDLRGRERIVVEDPITKEWIAFRDLGELLSFLMDLIEEMRSPDGGQE
jgi:hypothetical protein